jgi:GAF domain-containing protein
VKPPDQPYNEATAGTARGTATHGPIVLTETPGLLAPDESLAVIQSVAERFADSDDLSAVLQTVAQLVRKSLGASAITVGVISADQSMLVTLLVIGFSPRSEALLSKPLPLAGRLPATHVLRHGTPIFWSSLEERDRDYPEFASFPSDHEAWAILPLVLRGTPIGVLVLGWIETRRFSQTDSALLKLIAHQCAVAVDRARLQEEARGERATLELLGEGTRLMVSALDPNQILRSLVLLAVPRLAPWCAVYVADRGQLCRVAREVTGERLAKELETVSAVKLDSAAPLAVTYRTGHSRIVCATARRLRGIYTKASGAQVSGADAAWTALLVPVTAAGRVIGVMSLVSDRWAGAPPAQVRYAAEGLAGRAGVALANARRFERERLTAALLTEALLPTEVPTIPGFEAATRYLPAGSQVAGDWFDLAHLPSGRYLVGVGDAAGHGIRAASLMAQLRNAARGLAVGGNPPSRILHGLGLLTLEDDPESFATAVYATLDPSEGSVVWASAGHISPVLFGPEGARFLPPADFPPLGWPATGPPTDRLIQLEPKEGIVLLTDGVVERRGEDLANRLEMVRQVVARHGSDPAESLAGRIVASAGDQAEDDCCLVVLKRD